MLTLAAYRLETPELQDEECQKFYPSLVEIVNEWLFRKGVAKDAREAGKFISETSGAQGDFIRLSTSNAVGSLFEVTLTEPTKDGNTFITSIAIINSNGIVSLFLSLMAAISGKSIAPTAVYPRCPVLIREVLDLRDDWLFGGSKVPSPRPISVIGAKAASELVDYLMNESRTLPVAVVSELEGEPVWEDLPEKLAIDLAGLSSVIRIDAEASWALNELIGKSRSCYLGATRIYWPLGHATDDPSELRSKVWTAERLLSNDSDGKGLSRFTTALRRQVMSVAALAVDTPSSVRKIKNEQSRARLFELQQQAAENTQGLELARLLMEENESLQDQLEKANAEAARQASRAEMAEYALEVLKSGGLDEEPNEDDDIAPKTGEIRYYKKTHSTPGYDVLVRIRNCGHNSWQAANKADKAKRGVEKLEGRTGWKKMFHCGSCKGGGVWKVIW